MSSDQLAHQIVIAVTDAMESAGVDRAELARRMGSSRSAVTQLLQGKNFETATLAKLATALNLTCWFDFGTKQERRAALQIRKGNQ